MAKFNQTKPKQSNNNMINENFNLGGYYSMDEEVNTSYNPHAEMQLMSAINPDINVEDNLPPAIAKALMKERATSPVPVAGVPLSNGDNLAEKIMASPMAKKNFSNPVLNQMTGDDELARNLQLYEEMVKNGSGNALKDRLINNLKPLNKTQQTKSVNTSQSNQSSVNIDYSMIKMIMEKVVEEKMDQMLEVLAEGIKEDRKIILKEAFSMNGIDDEEIKFVIGDTIFTAKITKQGKIKK